MDRGRDVGSASRAEQTSSSRVRDWPAGASPGGSCSTVRRVRPTTTDTSG